MIKTKGTTIVELLIYMGLLSIFLVLLVNILVTTLSFRLGTESSSALNQDMRFIMSKLSYELYNADNLSLPVAPGDESSSLVLTSDGVQKTYSVDGNNNLVETSGGVASALNSTGTRITGINFERIGVSGETPTVKINFTLESTITLQGGVTESETIETTFGLR